MKAIDHFRSLASEFEGRGKKNKKKKNKKNRKKNRKKFEELLDFDYDLDGEEEAGGEEDTKRKKKKKFKEDNNADDDYDDDEGDDASALLSETDCEVFNCPVVKIGHNLVSLYQKISAIRKTIKIN